MRLFDPRRERAAFRGKGPTEAEYVTGTFLYAYLQVNVHFIDIIFSIVIVVVVCGGGVVIVVVVVGGVGVVAGW